MQHFSGISGAIKKTVITLITITLFTANTSCGDSAYLGGLGVLAFLGYTAIQDSNNNDPAPEPDKGFCENFANLSSCYDASPSPDNTYWSSCAQAHAFCCDYAFGGASLPEYQNSCNAVTAEVASFPDLAGHCEACQDVENLSQ